MDSLRLDTALLVALVMQGFLDGVFIVLFVAACYVLINKKKTDNINYVFLVAACLMCIMIIINFSVSFSRIIEAFITKGGTPSGAIDFLADLTNWKEVFRTGDYIVLTAIADSLFIYRLYIVWSRNVYVTIVPILLLLASATTGIGIEVAISSLNGSAVFATGIAQWATSFFTISLAQNLLTTFLIVYRIWRVNVGVVRMGQSSLWPVMAVLLESGAIYSSTLFILLMTYVSGSFAQYIALDMLVPIIGITFCLIIVRVGLGLTKSAGPPQQTTAASRPLPLQKININVSRQVDVDQDVERAGGDSDTMDETYDKMADLGYESKRSLTHSSSGF